MREALVSIAVGAALFFLLRAFGLSFNDVSPWSLFGAAALCFAPVVWSEVRRSGR